MVLNGKSSVIRQLCSSCKGSKRRLSQQQVKKIPNLSDQHESRFKKVLIANRGEIACRIIRTAKKMGIKTVAVYSVADSQAKHVKLADEAVFIGPSPATESYLNINKIMEAIRATNADAVHPGYGFLSENPEFVRVLETESVAFIGPSAEVISKMGDKLESKRTALAAGVNVIPGFDEIVADADHCVEIAEAIGYPVMIKASAGGGGKGMRIAWNEQDVRDGFLLARQEAQSSFGDSRLLVEKFIENPRHIEIQVLGDKHGNVVHLNERECSIQRRNQKVIEEAPSVFLDEQTRRAMGHQSVTFCKALKYSSAGTVEFLVDKNRNFYFLEMNTRLQVEHPVTECITGLDLVEEMIMVAEGHKLKLSQKDVKIHGWAIEARIYAEDPYKSLGLPSIGRLYKYQEPPGARCDSGIEEGSKIPIYYDPLICKLVSWAETRRDAISTITKALDSYVIRGIHHNIPLLRDILSQSRFLQGDLSTDYLALEYPEGFKGLVLQEGDKLLLVAVASALYAFWELRKRSFRNICGVSGKLPEKWSLLVRLEQKRLFVDVFQSRGEFKVEVEGQEFRIDRGEIKPSQGIMELTFEGEKEKKVFQLVSRNASGEYQMIFYGNCYKLEILEKKASEYLSLMPTRTMGAELNELRAPMSGLVKSVFCSEGDYVSEGQDLLVIEAMKMQNLMVAQSGGRIKHIIKPGDTVTSGDILARLE